MPSLFLPSLTLFAMSRSPLVRLDQAGIRKYAVEKPVVACAVAGEDHAFSFNVFKFHSRELAER